MMDIENIQGRIDEADKSILSLFMERMKLSEAAAEYQQNTLLPAHNRQREREKLAKVQENAGEYGKYAYYLFSALMGFSIDRQLELTRCRSTLSETIKKGLQAGGELFPQTGVVACQGVEGAYSQVACDKLFSRGKLMYVKSFEAVFNAVESGLCEYGVVPVENSSNGSIRAVYDLLQSKLFSIVRATSLHICHELLAKPGVALGDIREIYSHEQALGQCSRFIASLGENVKVIPCANTAVAAKLVSQSKREDCAAVSSHACAALYGLFTVCDSIQNSDNNYTRFICIAKEPAIYAGADKISLIHSCNNTPGALYEILSRFAARGVNMSKLESCPIKGKGFDFVFFVELDASVNEQGTVAMLEDLERCCESFSFLGSYSMV